MAVLWKSQTNYRKFDPQSWEDLREANSFPERFLPYERLYRNLTREELLELLQDAKEQHWEVLDLRYCGLNVLPDMLGEMENLKVLSLGNHSASIAGASNNFSELPNSVENLQNLQSLNLRNSEIRILPAAFGKLESLKLLNLEYSKIGVLPYSVGTLTNLQSLDLSSTKISVLPDSIGNLTNLQSLDLHKTPISVLPDSIGNLTNLPSLNLSDTRINKLPDSIGNLTNLQSLNLSNTEISKLPDSIGNLTNLQSLDLSDTKISVLPDSIGNLTNLQSLNLGGCHLKAIPYSVVALGLPFVTNRWTNENINNCVNLSNVTLDEGNLQLFAQSREVIEAAYQGEKQIVRECKVIFLGDGGAGKTALIKRVTSGQFTPGTLPTDGIATTVEQWFMSVEMTKWPSTVKNEPFIVRFLDFGGQEIMHSAHRCFLTDHTVYVVVCESRGDTEIDSAAARWLRSVKAFAPECPIILALNKADLNPNVSVNERDLKGWNNNLKCVLKTSAAKETLDYGVENLKRAIKQEIPSAMNRYPLNKNMLGVKQALESMRETEKKGHISSERYQKICKEHNIADKTLQYEMLKLFRDLGVAYYYESSAFDNILNSVQVLNPEWLTNGIYRLILRTPENGFLPHEVIKRTLGTSHPGDIHSDIKYTEDETEYILHVMRLKGVEISHVMGENKDIEMIPLKMSKNPPSNVDKLKENALHLRWEGTYMPNNLIHRLLIRKFGELDTECVWRTGGRFKQTNGGCEALAEMNESALDVYVSGERDCRPYLETFRGVIQNILNELNLKPKEVICCRLDGQDAYVSYEDVLQLYYDKQDRFLIPSTRTYANPAELLRETYVSPNKELSNHRQMEYGVLYMAQLPDKSSEKLENPLDDEKIRAEIEQLKAEAKKNNVAVTLTVARALLIPALIVLAWVAGRSDLIEKFLEFLFSLFNG